MHYKMVPLHPFPSSIPFHFPNSPSQESALLEYHNLDTLRLRLSSQPIPSSTPRLPPIQECPPRDDARTNHDHDIYLIDQLMRATLTVLLSCEEVKGDGEMRAWVQERLWRVEGGIKRYRRGVVRRSSGGSGDGGWFGKREVGSEVGREGILL